MVALDYEVTKAWIYRKYWRNGWSYDDFEDRYQDSWESFLRYGVPEGMVPLTVFSTIFRTWYSQKQSRKRELKGESILVNMSDEDILMCDAGYKLDTEQLLLSSKLNSLDLSDYHRAIMVMKLAGYSEREIADEFDVTPNTIHEAWVANIIYPVVHGKTANDYWSEKNKRTKKSS